jgi:uncharacterized ion transporter superfamily protein YfcC
LKAKSLTLLIPNSCCVSLFNFLHKNPPLLFKLFFTSHFITLLNLWKVYIATRVGWFLSFINPFILLTSPKTYVAFH